MGLIREPKDVDFTAQSKHLSYTGMSLSINTSINKQGIIELNTLAPTSKIITMVSFGQISKEMIRLNIQD